MTSSHETLAPARRTSVHEPLPPDMLEADREALAEPVCEAPDEPAANVLALRSAVARLAGRDFGPFDLALEARERVAILGPSGAGKSTLLKLMAGERSAHSGSVRLDGRPLQAWRTAALAQRRAMLPQSHSVAFGMPVELIVSLGRIAREPDPHRMTAVGQSLEAARASHLAGRRFDTLSGGEQARVQLARVFAQLWDVEGALLLVDEPLAALDPGLQFDLMAALQDFASRRGHALVAVLHDLNQALASFDRLWLVSDGRLQADLRSDADAVPALERLYGIALRTVEGTDGAVAVLAIHPPSRRTS